jgi:hypothetical protein
MAFTLILGVPFLKLMTWLVLYLALFVMAIIKYAVILDFVKIGNLRSFIKKKVKIDTAALLFICIVIGAAMILKNGLIAIIIIFLMEFLHILYVSFVDRIYKI